MRFVYGNSPRELPRAKVASTTVEVLETQLQVIPHDTGKFI